MNKNIRSYKRKLFISIPILQNIPRSFIKVHRSVPEQIYITRLYIHVDIVLNVSLHNSLRFEAVPSRIKHSSPIVKEEY